MKKITKRLVISHQIIRDLSLREVRGGAGDTEPCGTSIARGRCVVALDTEPCGTSIARGGCVGAL